MLHEISHEINKQEDKSSQRTLELAATLKYLGSVLGLLQDDPETVLTAGSSENGLGNEEINLLIEERSLAKKSRNYAKADEIREQLTSKGILIEDSPEGTTWRRI